MILFKQLLSKQGMKTRQKSKSKFKMQHGDTFQLLLDSWSCVCILGDVLCHPLHLL